MNPRACLRGRAAAAVAVVALGAAGCGDDGAEESERPVALNVYVSAPLSGPAGSDGQDIADGARLALADAGAEAGGATIAAEYLDAAGRDETRSDPVIATRNARSATEDSAAVAYIGELDSGATRSSLPVTNSAGILQVAPGSGADDLVRSEPFNDDVPTDVQGTGERTFGRVLPGDQAQAQAGAAFANELELTPIALVSDSSEFAETMAADFENAAERAGVEVTGRLPRALYAPGPPVDGDGSRAGGVEAGAGLRSVLVSDAWLPRSDELRRRFGDQEFYATSAALDPSRLPPAGQDFLGRFEAEYDRTAGNYAAYGYEAMASVLAAIDRAGNPEDRASVVDAYLDGTRRDSVLGSYEITETGETTLERITGYRLGSGAAREPIAELTPP